MAQKGTFVQLACEGHPILDCSPPTTKVQQKSMTLDSEETEIGIYGI